MDFTIFQNDLLHIFNLNLLSIVRRISLFLILTAENAICEISLHVNGFGCTLYFNQYTLKMMCIRIDYCDMLCLPGSYADAVNFNGNQVLFCSTNDLYKIVRLISLILSQHHS